MSSCLLLLRPVQALRQITQILWSKSKTLQLWIENWTYCWWKKSGEPVEVGSWNPIIYNRFNFLYISQVVVWDFWTINSSLSEKGWENEFPVGVWVTHVSFSWEKNATGKQEKQTRPRRISDLCSPNINVSSLWTTLRALGLLVGFFHCSPPSTASLITPSSATGT